MAYIANCSNCNVLSKTVKPRASSFALTLSSSFLRSSVDSNHHTSRLRFPEIRFPRAAAKVVAKEGVAEMAVTELERENRGVLRVGLICGGPSAERGISLNSARSVLDHIQVRRGKCRIGPEFPALRLRCY